MEKIKIILDILYNNPILFKLLLLILVFESILFFYLFPSKRRKAKETRTTILYISLFVLIVCGTTIFLLTFGSPKFREIEFPLGKFSTNMSDWGDFATCIATIFTAVSVILAYKAFMEQQLQLKRASFDSLFTQMMAQHIALHEKLMKGKKDNETSIFISYYQKLNNKNTTTINQLWEEYRQNEKADDNENYENLKNYFKFIFHEISLIKSYESTGVLSKKLAEKYVLLIQAQMNNYELLCYLINQIDYYDRYARSNKKYLIYLKKRNFFKDLFKSTFFKEQLKILKEISPSDCPIWPNSN